MTHKEAIKRLKKMKIDEENYPYSLIEKINERINNIKALKMGIEALRKDRDDQ